MVRPHVAALLGMATVVGYLLKRTPEGKKSSVLAPVGKLIVLAVLVAGMVVAVGQLEEFFGVDSFDREAVQMTLDDVVRRTGQGGSQFTERTETDLSVTRLPQAFVNVLFRPFPWDANNAQSLIASAEAVFLFGLVLTSWRRIVSAALGALRHPYVALSCAFSVLFVYGFSSFSNSGILVRQRVQVLPFVLVLLCLPQMAFRRSRRVDPVSP